MLSGCVARGRASPVLEALVCLNWAQALAVLKDSCGKAVKNVVKTPPAIWKVLKDKNSHKKAKNLTT